MHKNCPMRSIVQAALLTGLVLAFASGCRSDSTGLQPVDYPDLFDRFTTVTLATAEALPQNVTAIRFFPHSDELLVLGKAGIAGHYRLVESGVHYLGGFEVPDVAPGPAELGLTGLAFDPDFANNGFLYMCFSTGDNRWNRVIRLRWSRDYAAVVASIRTVIDVDRVFPDEPQHGVYDLCFGADGRLYVAMGDATQPEFAQDPTSLLGKLLRLAPRHTDAGGYEIPPDNPYLDEAHVRPEIAAFGLRTPFRLLAWRDFIYVADVGENAYEEIELYRLGKRNFGWPFCEGYCEAGGYEQPVFTISHADPYYQTVDPDKSGSNRLSISLGVAYDSRSDDPYAGLLAGRILIYDTFQGYVRAALVLPDGRLRNDQHIFHRDFITGMDTGPDGYIYGTTIFNSQIFRVELKR